jgi:hypothetical protein
VKRSGSKQPETRQIGRSTNQERKRDLCAQVPGLSWTALLDGKREAWTRALCALGAVREGEGGERGRVRRIEEEKGVVVVENLEFLFLWGRWLEQNVK